MALPSCMSGSNVSSTVGPSTANNAPGFGQPFLQPNSHQLCPGAGSPQGIVLEMGTHYHQFGLAPNQSWWPLVGFGQHQSPPVGLPQPSFPANSVLITTPAIVGVAPTFQASTEGFLDALPFNVLFEVSTQQCYDEFGQLDKAIAYDRPEDVKLGDEFASSLDQRPKTIDASLMACTDNWPASVSDTGGIGMPPDSLVTLSDVSKLCRDGQINSVLSAMDTIENRGLHISVHMLSSLLQLCMDRTDSRAGKALHHLLIRLGYDENDHLASQVIHMYLLCGSLPEALQALNKLSIANVLIWNAAICAYARIGSNEQALKLYYQMQQSGVTPDGHILVAALKACSALASLDDGRLIHCYIIKRGLETNSFILSTLIDMYSSCSSLADSQRVFNAAPIQNVVAWNTFIKGHIEHGLELKAVELYHQMMLQGVEVDRITFITILRTCASVWDLDKGKAVHLEVVKKGVDSDSLIVARLIDMYSCSGQLLEAQLVFEEAPKQDVKVWNAMIAAHAQHGQNEAALILVESLWQAGLEANISTSMSLLKDSASQVFPLDQVRFLHGTIVKMGFDRESSVMNTFISMYAKSGSLQDACRNFSSVLSPGLVTWNAIIGAHVLFEEGCGPSAKPCDARHCFEGLPQSKHARSGNVSS